MTSNFSFRTDDGLLEFGLCLHEDGHEDRNSDIEMRIGSRYVTFTSAMLEVFAQKLRIATLATKPYQGRVVHPTPEWNVHTIFIATEDSRIKITIGVRGHGPTSAELTKEQAGLLADAVLRAR